MTTPDVLYVGAPSKVAAVWKNEPTSGDFPAELATVDFPAIRRFHRRRLDLWYNRF
jgi:hypothetical protein